MQPPTLMGRSPLSDAANFSSNCWLTIVGHWLLPMSKTLIGFCTSLARTSCIARPAMNRVTAQVIEVILIELVPLGW